MGPAKTLEKFSSSFAALLGFTASCKPVPAGQCAGAVPALGIFLLLERLFKAGR